jgi:hypothetical protein
MPISYITSDLECASAANLSALVQELAENVIVHLNDWIDGVYRVAVGLGHTDTTPEDAFSFYCSLVEKLTDESKALWAGCTRRAVDIVFESGTEPESQTFQLPEALVQSLFEPPQRYRPAILSPHQTCYGCVAE